MQGCGGCHHDGKQGALFRWQGVARPRVGERFVFHRVCVFSPSFLNPTPPLFLIAEFYLLGTGYFRDSILPNMSKFFLEGKTWGLRDRETKWFGAVSARGKE